MGSSLSNQIEFYCINNHNRDHKKHLSLMPLTLFHHYSVEAFCLNSLGGGNHEIKIYVGTCIGLGFLDDTNRVITGGLGTPSRLHVEEVRTSQSIDVGN